MSKRGKKMDTEELEIPEFLKRRKGEPPRQSNEIESDAKDNWFDKPTAIADPPSPTPKPKKPRKPSRDTRSIQERTQDKINDLISEVDEYVEKFYENDYKTTWKPFKWCVYNKDRVKATHAKGIADYYTPHLEEIQGAIAKTDPDLVEGYDHLNKHQKKRIEAFLNMLIEDCIRWADANRRTKRAPRRQTVEQRIKHLKFKDVDPEWKIKSIDPGSLLDCQQLWVFNCKNRKLSMYNALDRGGLKLHRSSIRNFDEETSIEKTLRKPLDILPKVIDSGVVTLRKLMPSIKTAKKQVNGRINKDTILLRVIK